LLVCYSTVGKSFRKIIVQIGFIVQTLAGPSLYFNLFLKLDTICSRCLKREGISAGSKGYLGIGVNREYPWGGHLKIKAFQKNLKSLFDFYVGELKVTR